MIVALFLLLSAPDDEAVFKRAMRLYQTGEFAAAIGILDEVRASNARGPERERACLLLGMNFLALNNEKRAHAYFAEIIALNPDYELSALLAPNVRAAIEGERTKAFRRVEISHQPPKQVLVSQEVRLDFALTPASKTLRLRVAYRVAGEPSYDLAMATGDDAGQRWLELGSSVLARSRGDALEYYAEVLSAGDDVVAQTGSPATPLRVKIARPKEPASAAAPVPVYKRWWFWTLIGVGVAAGSTAAIVAGVTRPALGDVRAQIVIDP